MKIKQFTTKIIYEGLQKGEYYVWKVNFQDGTSTRVKIKHVETSKASLEQHFGKPIASIDHNFSIRGGSMGDAADRKEYHSQQDSLDSSSAKAPWQTQAGFNEESVNELSNDTMQSYKTAASSEQSFKSRPLRKLAKSVRSVADATRKIDAKTKTHTYESRLEAFVTEADVPKNAFSGILNKQHKEKAGAARPGVVDIPFHGWTIRYRPATAGKNTPWQVMDKKGDVKHKGEATTDKDAIRDAEEWIKQGGGTGKRASTSVTIDFNAEFMQQIAPDGQFYAAIDVDNNTPMLIISTEPQSGFKLSHNKPTRSGNIGLPVISLTAAQSNAANLQPNGRYVLGSKDVIDDNTSMFPLIFQSITQSSSDKVRLNQPGLTVASSERSVSEEQGVAENNSSQYTGQISDPEERARIHDLKSLYGMFGNAAGVQRARHLDSKGLLKATP